MFIYCLYISERLYSSWQVRICDLKNDKDLKRNMWIKLGEEAVESISEIRVFTLFFLMVNYLSSIHKGIHTTVAHTQTLYHIPGGLSYTRFFSLFWQPNYSFLGNTSSVKVLHSLQFMVQRYFFLPSHLLHTPSLSSHAPGRFLPCLHSCCPFSLGWTPHFFGGHVWLSQCCFSITIPHTLCLFTLQFCHTVFLLH